MDAAMSVAITLGPLIGGSLANWLSFTATFGTSLAIAILLLLYLLIVFPSSEAVSVDSLAEDTTNTSILSVFKQSVSSTASTLHQIFKIPTASALITILAIFGFLLAGAQVFFLFYASNQFGWTSLDFGQFALIAASQKILWLSFLLPSFLRFVVGGGSNSDVKVAWEIFVLRTSLFFAIVGEICYSLAPSSLLFVCSSFFASMSCFTGPTVRSLLSTLVPPSHQGRLFGSIQLFESLSAIFATTGLNLVYQYTVHVVPQAVFWVMAALLGFALFLSIHVVRKENVLAMDMALHRVHDRDGRGEEVAVVHDENTPLL
ncbi:major facilitator superfamily domain-containing protein [Obelidium mucronatum]|nr:major facilitator superfamily domain-containing protein [Obelidium mucronatum]